jgi:hypothetical protein
LKSRQPLLVVLALYLLASVPATLHAQSAPDGNRLQLGADSLYVYRIARGDTVATGRILERLAAVVVGGERRMQRIYITADEGMGAEVDSIEDTMEGLEPRRLRVLQRNRDILVRFTGDSALGYSKSPFQASAPVAAALAPGVIDGFSFDMYLRAADLALGRRFDLTVYDPSARKLTPTSAEVVGDERVAGVPSWHLRGRFGEMPVEFWIAKDGRRLRRQLIYPTPGLGILFVTEPLGRQ